MIYPEYNHLQWRRKRDHLLDCDWKKISNKKREEKKRGWKHDVAKRQSPWETQWMTMLDISMIVYKFMFISSTSGRSDFTSLVDPAWESNSMHYTFPLSSELLLSILNC